MSLVALLVLAQASKAPTVGDTLPRFTLAAREGQPYRWQPGRATVICFCAFWCDTWRDQLPRLSDAARDLNGLPVDFLTVSVDGRWSEQGAHAAVGKSLSDPGNRWCSPHGIDRVPYTVVVDPSGTIRWSSSGVLRSGDVVDAVRTAMKGRSSSGTVYLTFDDYPAPKLNDELLDVLRREKTPATFFCICSRLQEFRAQMKRTASEGHELEIHGWNHDESSPDFARCRSALARFGGDGTLYRAHGSEHVVVVGSGASLAQPVIDPYDYQRPGVKELVRRVTNQLRSGAIIQLHAGVRDTIDALPSLIENARKRGFTFEVLRAGGT